MTGMSGHDYWDRTKFVGDALTVNRDGISYKIHDPGGNGRIAKTLRKGNPVEPAVLDDMRALGLTGRAIDAGGGVGNHALWLAIACGLTVETFEPRLRAKVAANIRLNNLEERMTLHPVALGEAHGYAKWSNKQKGHLDVDTDGAVEVRTLDSYQFEDVALVKIDVEGMEQAVIRGGMETIAHNRPVIYAEAWNDEYREATAELLSPLGYRQGTKFKWHQQRWDPS